MFLQRAARNLLSLTTAAVFLGVSAGPTAQSSISPKRSSDLTFDKRVECQRAIEKVYWRHRIGSKGLSESKPPFDEVMPAAAIRDKVREYLRASDQLEKTDRALSPAQLKGEIDRMVRNSKAPDILREIFTALDDDSELIAECLARPVLAERLTAKTQIPESWKQRYSARGAEGDIQSATSARDSMVGVAIENSSASTAAAACVDDTWGPGSTVNTPMARGYTTAVWTGTEMIVWGGYACAGSTCFPVATGGRYNPATDTWTATSNTNVPSARFEHTAVWTGTQMIVWGGTPNDDNYLNSGGKYNPANNTWTATSLTNAPIPRALHTAIWTGSEMIVWGGLLYDPFSSTTFYFNDGGRYNPTTNTWVAISTTNAPSARTGHGAVWTGTEMIIWGGGDTVGNNTFEFFNTGGRYNPSNNTWTATSTTNAPTARRAHATVWTGSEMIVWGGNDQSALDGSVPGGKYKPSTNSWTPTSTTNAPSHGSAPALWTGTEMIVWEDFYRVGGRYHAAGDRWTPITKTNAPEIGSNARVWTGSQMLLWGGEYLATKYCANSGVVTDGANITAENCSWSNGVLDPGETVTVDFCLRNSGSQPTTNLVATLQGTGGVTNPSAAQSYGAIAPGGPDACRSFTFTANGNCGDIVTATLQLQDGTTNLGTVAYTFRIGAQQNLLTQSFGSIVYDFTGWVTQNNSQPAGTTSWFQGSTTAFPALNGGDSYIAANFQNTGTTGTISDWLLTPPVKLQTGTRLTFYTRTAIGPVIPDRLQVRMSLNGDSTNVGGTATSVGDFTNLLLDINPTYTPAGYPTAWTRYTVILSGIQSPTIGRLAFRYFVENGGSAGTRSNYIGIDNVSVDNYICCAGPILGVNSVKLLSNHDIFMEFRGAPNRPNRVEISNDNVHVTDTFTITPDATGLFTLEFVDPRYDPKKFYRIRVP